MIAEFNKGMEQRKLVAGDVQHDGFDGFVQDVGVSGLLVLQQLIQFIDKRRAGFCFPEPIYFVRAGGASRAFIWAFFATSH